MLKSLLATTCAVGILVAVPVFAEDKSGTNSSDGASGQGGAVALMAMAQDLYAYGIANKDALSILNAARITGSVDAKDVEREMETQKIEGAEDIADEEGTDAPVDAAAMYADAKDLAGGDDALMGMIEDAMAEGSRGRMGGATRTLSRLRAGHTDIFKVPFYGGQLAEIAIVGDGDANLDLVVNDENGNTICLDKSYSDKVYCSWTPAWNGYFIIGVRNMGRIRNSYYILTN